MIDPNVNQQRIKIMWFKPHPKNDNQAQSNLSEGKTYSRPRRRATPVDKSRATTIMKAMGNTQRLQILSHLINGEERSVKELENMIATLSQSALSQHLGRLRRAKILRARRDSQMVYYSIYDDNVQDIITLLTQIYDEDPALNKNTKQ